MRLDIVRETLLRPLQYAASVIDRRPQQQHPIYGHLKLSAAAGKLTLIGNDGEAEMRAWVAADVVEEGETTASGAKLLEIVRNCPQEAVIELRVEEGRLRLRAGRGVYRLATLPASDFPSIDEFDGDLAVVVTAGALKSALQRTAFAMAQNDVRVFLNGVLFDVEGNRLRCVATEGHRLALAERPLAEAVEGGRQFIVPRKAVLEMQRILGDLEEEEVLRLEVGVHLLRLRVGAVCFTSRLIDARYPDYQAVIPIHAERVAKIGRESLRSALQRVAILANEKLRGVRLEFGEGEVRLSADNPEREEAVEEIDAEGNARGILVGFNVQYLLDALGAVSGERVVLKMRDGQSSALLQAEGEDKELHVIMPLRL